MNNIVGLCLSTNNPESIKKILLPSLSNFTDFKDVCTVLINFQPPYTPSEIIEVVNTFESFGFKVIYDYNDYPKELFEINVPIGKIRNDTAKLNPNSLIYCLIDDDFSFRGPTDSLKKVAGSQYLDIVRYMMEYPQCGVTLIGGYLYKKVPTDYIAPVSIDNTFLNSKGIFLRNNIKNCLITPLDSEWVVGCDEEKIACAARIYEGMYVAKMRAGKVRHYENAKIKRDSCALYQWDKVELVENNATKYIKEHYNPEFGGNLTQIGGSNYYNVVTEDQYYSKGGLSWEDPKIAEQYTINFSEISVQDNLKRISELYSIYNKGESNE